MLTLNRSAYEAQTPAYLEPSRGDDRRRDAVRSIECAIGRRGTLHGHIWYAVESGDCPVPVEEIEEAIAETLALWTAIRDRANPAAKRRESQAAPKAVAR